MQKIGFDHDKYVKLQSEHIRQRISSFGGKLYLEFGGKRFDDYHASRVLPGFQPDSKMQMLRSLSDQVEIIIVINASDIEKNKVRGDLGITYDQDVLRLIDVFRGFGLYVGSVVITRYARQPAARHAARRLGADEAHEEGFGFDHHVVRNLLRAVDGHVFKMDEAVAVEAVIAYH